MLPSLAQLLFRRGPVAVLHRQLLRRAYWFAFDE